MQVLQMPISNLDNNDNLLWVKKWEDMEYKCEPTLMVDDIGNIYSMGNLSSAVHIDFNPGLGIFELTSNGNDIIFKNLTLLEIYMGTTNYVRYFGTVKWYGST